MRVLRSLLHYFFYPNPGHASYGDSWVIGILAACAALVLLSFAIRLWRSRQENPITKKLSRSWASASFWFGITGILFIVSRVEGIQFLAMRFPWVLFGVAAVLYLFFQIRQFRARHYEILPNMRVEDAREKYLPQRKKR